LAAATVGARLNEFSGQAEESMSEPPAYPDFSQAPQDHIAYAILTFGRMVLHSVKKNPLWKEPDREALERAVKALNGAQLSGADARFGPEHLAAAYLIGAHCALPNSLYEAAVRGGRIELAKIAKRAKKASQNAAIAAVYQELKDKDGRKPSQKALLDELDRRGHPMSRSTLQRSFKSLNRKKSCVTS
jgi:hypothetical protein